MDINEKIESYLSESADNVVTIDYASNNKKEIDDFIKLAKKNRINVKIFKMKGPSGWPELEVSGKTRKDVIEFLKKNYDEDVESFI